MNKTYIAIAVVAVVAVLGLFYPTVKQSLVTSAVGTTFSTAKLAQINFSPATGSATSTSILNTDDSDRIVTDSFVTCSGLGSSFTAYAGAALNNLIFKAGTTSTSAPNSVTNTNLVMNVNVATTTTTDAYNSTSTFSTAVIQRWASGSYMTFFSNATNTAACSVGVHYLAS